MREAREGLNRALEICPIIKKAARFEPLTKRLSGRNNIQGRPCKALISELTPQRSSRKRRRWKRVEVISLVLASLVDCSDQSNSETKSPMR